MILGVIGGSHVWKYANLAKVGLLFCGIQPIVSFCFAMMKIDVRKYTIDLLTLSYIRKAPDTKPCTSVNDTQEITCQQLNTTLQCTTTERSSNVSKIQL